MERECRAIAFHEAGHAALADWCGRQLERVELTPDHPGQVGCCFEKVEDPHALSRAVELGEEDVIRPQIQIQLAGRAAQQKSGYEGLPGGDRRDSQVALRLAIRMVGCVLKAEQVLEQARVETRRILDLAVVWAGVEALVAELLRTGSVEGGRAHRILAEARNAVEPL
jgi:hypothetical protein